MRTITFAGMLVVCMASLPAGSYGLDFVYTTNNYAVTITAYTGAGGAVSIPDLIEGLPVTTIGDWAFSSIAALTGVVIPNSVTNIGELRVLLLQ